MKSSTPLPEQGGFNEAVPDGIEVEAWRSTRKLREAISELHKTYGLHMKEKHEFQKYCLCPEMDSYTKAYAYYKQELMRALYPPDPKDIARSFEQRAVLVDLLKENIIDEETVKRLLDVREEGTHGTK